MLSPYHHLYVHLLDVSFIDNLNHTVQWNKMPTFATVRIGWILHCTWVDVGLFLGSHNIESFRTRIASLLALGIRLFRCVATHCGHLKFIAAASLDPSGQSSYNTVIITLHRVAQYMCTLISPCSWPTFYHPTRIKSVIFPGHGQWVGKDKKILLQDSGKTRF